MCSTQEQHKGLAREDEVLLDSLLNTFLFDPSGAERVRVLVDSPRSRAGETREGWLVKNKAGDQVFFTDGEHIAAPAKEKIARVDFVAKCRKLYEGKPDPNGAAFAGFLDSRPSGHWGEEPTLVVAAWLYRLGKKELAAQVLAHAPDDRKADAARLRRWLAEAALNRMILAYGGYVDSSALAHGERLLRLYKVEARELPQAQPLVKDLLRRKEEGRLGKRGARELPQAYRDWGRQRQLAFLIGSLDEMEDRIGHRVGYPESELPPRIAALLKFGERAVPALLDVLEKDERMTRLAQGPDKWRSTGRVQAVREVAWAVLCRILRVRHFDPWDPNARDDYGAVPSDMQKAAAEARAYWKEFGRLSFEERLMRVLNHPRSSFPAIREAVRNLPGAWSPNESDWPNLVKDRKPSPAVLKFAKPTAAEAILCAMDRDLAHDDTLERELRDHNRAYHEPLYFTSLLRLADRRIAPELSRRAAVEKNALMRLRYAHASYRLGQPQALRTFAREFAAGAVGLSLQPDGSPSRWQLEHIIEYFAGARLPETERALYKLGGSGHPYHKAAVDGLIEREVVYGSVGSFLDHPYCVALLRGLLEDETPTRVRLSIQGLKMRLRRKGGGYIQSSQVPAVLLDPAKRKDEAALRRCDLAGEMCGLIAGLPAFHPLLNEADDRLAAMRKVLDRFRGKFRALTEVEKEILAGNTYEVRFGPEIRPLGRPATAADVAAGRAIFHVHGKGKVADVMLPARGTFRPAPGEQTPRHCLVVQAERDAHGAVCYGVIEQHAIRLVPASELADVTPLKRLKGEL
jgi:hypothetical protein